MKKEKTYKEYLDEIIEYHHVYAFKKAQDEEIQQYINDLVKKGLPPLPKDYIEFLLYTDGLCYDPIKLWGVKKHFTEGECQLDLKEYNEDFQDKNYLLLGEIAPLELIAYNNKEGRYEILESTSFTPSEKSYDSFMDVLEKVIMPRIKNR